jgi:L-ribulose-5-phosphate 3-epimerase
MNIGGHDVGVCSWSLQPQGMQELVTKMRELGLEHLQLALVDLVHLDDKRKHQELGHLRAGGVKFTGGMMGYPGEDYSTIAAIHRTGGFLPDDQWPIRKRLSQEAVKLARELAMPLVATHVGFVPPASDPGFQKMVSRVREIAAMCAEQKLDLLMETGQERADALLQFLHALNAPDVYVNFDPANMILYGAGDPIDAIRTLGRHIRHVHVKDATASKNPGQDWGEEVPFGTGQVGAKRFLDALHSVGYRGPLVIEREAGSQRVADVRTAIESLRSAGI